MSRNVQLWTALAAHQRFVKTTPKPRATKKRSGELVGPPPPLLPLSLLVVAEGKADVVEEDGELIAADGRNTCGTGPIKILKKDALQERR